MLALLRAQPNFRAFWLGQAISQIGDRVHSLAVLWLVYQWTASGFAVGLVLVATSLPGVLIGPLAGEYADRWNRRHVLIVADLARAGIVFWLAGRAWIGALTLPELLVATALLSLGSAFFNPTALALMPLLVPREELTRANAMNQLSTSASGTLGPLVGSGLIATIGVPLAFAVNACSFLCSAAFEAVMRVASPPPHGRRSVWVELREGWQAALKEPLVVRLLGPIVLINFFFAGISVLVPVLAEGVYRAGAGGMGLMMSAYGLGLLLGAAGLSLASHPHPTPAPGPPPPRHGPWIVGGMVGAGAAFLLMGAALWLPLTLVGLTAVGFAFSVSNINLISLYQELIPNELRGKIFGLLTTLSLSLQPIAYGVMGTLTDMLAPQAILLASGAVVALTALSLLRVRELRTV